MVKILSHYKQIKKKCAICEKDFAVFPYRAQKALYCSYKCRGTSLKGKCFYRPPKGYRFSIKTEFKGNSKSYDAIHQWLYRRKGKSKKCIWCDGKYGKFEWANVSHKYKKLLNDWIELCLPCHRAYDKKYRDELKRKNKKVVSNAIQ